MKSQTIRLLTVLQAIAVIISATVLIAHGYDMRIKEDKAIELANKEAERLGHDVKSMKVMATHYSAPQNEYLADSQDDYSTERRRNLEGKEYWAVYYYNPKFVKGGDFCIFIDSYSGIVIASASWK